MRPALLALSACLAAAIPASARTATDRNEVAAMLIERGFSCVATLEQHGHTWSGEGFDQGATVRFAVDADTGRLLSETRPAGGDY